jgi:hypothetical protein
MPMTSTQFEQTSNERTVSPAEAEQVVALWAKRQQEHEGNLSLQDLAEALGTTTPEIEALLANVRRASEPVPGVTATTIVRPNRRRALRTLVAILAVCAISMIAFAIVRSSGQRDAMAVGTGATAADVAAPPTPVSEVSVANSGGEDQQDVSASVPTGYTVSFDGYVAKGRQTLTPGDYPDAQLESSLFDEIKLMTPKSFVLQEISNARSKAMEGLEHGKDVEGILSYKEASISYARGASTERIPIALYHGDGVPDLVADEQAIAVHRLASRAAAGAVDPDRGQ